MHSIATYTLFGGKSVKFVKHYNKQCLFFIDFLEPLPNNAPKLMNGMVLGLGCGFAIAAVAILAGMATAFAID
jgi:hypothetical protein